MITETRPVRNLNMINPDHASPYGQRQRLELFAHFFPQGLDCYRKLKDGSLSRNDLDQFRDIVTQEFFNAISKGYQIPADITPQSFFTSVQDTAIGVIRRIVKRAFPHDRKRLDEMKNEITVRPQSPLTLFKLLVLPEGQVNQRAQLEAVRHLLIADTAARLYLGSRRAGIRDKLDEWNNIFNDQLFEGPYADGVDGYELYASHLDDTNKAVKIARKAIRVPQGQHLALHTLSARKVKDYGLVYVDVPEEDPVSATTKALVSAANNGGILQPVNDIQDNMRMTFVPLRYERKSSKDQSPQVKTLMEKVGRIVLGGISQTMTIRDIRRWADPLSSRHFIEVETSDLPVPIILEFMNAIDFINCQNYVGEKSLVTGIPEPVYNGPAKELEELRGYYNLLPYLFPKGTFRFEIDIRTRLLRTIDEKAAELGRRYAFEKAVYFKSGNDILASEI